MYVSAEDGEPLIEIAEKSETQLERIALQLPSFTNYGIGKKQNEGVEKKPFPDEKFPPIRIGWENSNENAWPDLERHEDF